METNSQPTSLSTQVPERKIKVSYVAIALLALIVIAGSFFVGYKVGKTQRITPQKLINTTQSNKNTNEQTYINSELGFSINIPASWITEEQVEKTKPEALDVKTTYLYSSKIGSIYQIQISSYLADNNQAADSDVFKYNVDEKSTVKIADQKTTKTLPLNNDEVDIINYLFKKDNRNYEIKIIVPNKTLQKNLGRPDGDIDLEFEKIVDEYEKILSTLEFNAAVPTSTNTQKPIDNWTDYTNTNLKISFKHPSSWSIRGYAGDQENYQNNKNTFTKFIISSPDNSMSIDVRNQVFEGAIDQCMASEETKEIDLDGTPYKMETYISKCESDINDTKITFLTSTTKKVNITFNYSRLSSTTAEALRDQIISTIRFIK